MVAWTTVKVSEWLPDQPDFENPGSTTATNCLPGATSYLPCPSLTTYSDAVGTATDDWIRGATAIRADNNNSYVYCGDAQRLWELSATSWKDISVTGAYSGTATDEIWRFTQWGSNRTLATNYNNAIQSISAGATTAVALAGSPPRARYIAQIRDWVVLAYTNDGTVAPSRVQWSAFNNPEIWTANVALQSGNQTLYEGGQITGLAEVAGQGLVISQNAIHAMTYVGPPVTWRFDRLAHNVGCKIPGSVAAHRDRVYFIGESDFWVFTPQVGLQSLGAEKVARYFLADVEDQYLERVSAAVDPIRNYVVWAYPNADASTGRPNRLLCYSWNTNRWTLIQEEVDHLFQFLSPGYTLEQLDNVNGSIDAITTSLDDPSWTGGTLSFAAFDENNKLVLFNGTPPLSATVDTAELRATPGRHTEVTSVRPLFEGGSVQVKLGTRATQDATVAYTSARSPSTISGECNMRSNARFTRVRLEISGNWSHVIGADLKIRPGGER